MMRKAGKGRKGNKSSRRADGRKPSRMGREISHPPPIPSYGISRDVRLRFQSTGSFAGSITFQNLLDTVLVASSASTGIDLFQQVRINSVEVWAIAAIGTGVTVQVGYLGQTAGVAGDMKLHTDTSMGVQPAHLRAHPDRLSQAAQFQPSVAAVAFFLDIPSNSVIDVSLSFRNPITGEATAAQNVLVAATPGAIYYRGLDGKTTALTGLPVEGAFAVI
jgi:hypothetical protein